jgi:WD40 repeat protein
VDEESQSAQIYTRLAETAVLHERGQAGLWRDPDLQLALDWRERATPNAAWGQRYHPSFDAAMKFLDASVNARDAAALEDERRRRREIRRTRVAAVIFFLLFMLSLAALTYASIKRNEAQEKSDAAVAALSRAEQANARAESALADAVRERDRANRQTGIAERNEEIAKGATDEAHKEKKAAEQAKAEAVKSAEAARLNARRAEVSRLEAEKQRGEAERQKNSAEAEAVRNRQLLYASDMTLAQQAYDANNATLVRQLLFSHQPAEGEQPRFEWDYLWHLLHREKRSITYINGFSSLSAAGDGKLLAVGRHNSVALWDWVTGQSKGSIANTGAREVGALALSPDGRRLAFTGVNTHAVSVVDTATLVKTALPVDGKAEITSLAFSSDGATLGVGYEDDRAELWDAASLKLGRTLSLRSSASYVTFSPKGGTFVAATVSGDVSAWSVTDPRFSCLANTRENGNSVNAAAVSPDGTLVAAGRSDGTVRLVRLAPCVATLLSEASIFGTARSPVRAVAFSPDGKLLAVGYEDSAVEVWDAVRLKKLATLKGHRDAVNSLFFLPDGKRFLTGADDMTIKLWDTESLILEDSPLEGSSPVNAVAFSPDGRTLATGGNDKTVRLWDVETHRKLDAPALKYKGPVNSVAFSPAGKGIAVGADDPPLSIWDSAVAGALPRQLVGTSATSPVRAVAYSPDGKFLVAADNKGPDHVLQLWNAETGTLIKEAIDEFAAAAILSLAVSRDGKMIAVALGDGSVEVWDAAVTGRLFSFEKVFSFSKNPAYSVAFSPGGDMLAAGMGNGEVKLFDLNKGVEIAKRRGHKGEVFAVAFSPDGKTLATGGKDSLIKLWATDSFKELITLGGHGDAVMSLAFSPDGRTLASASADRTARLWRAPDAKAQER